MLHSALALMFGHHQEWDPCFHFLGGIAGAYGLLKFLEASPKIVPRVVLRNRTRLVIGLMSAITLLWEVGEFISDRFFSTHVQHGAADTASDVFEYQRRSRRCDRFRINQTTKRRLSCPLFSRTERLFRLHPSLSTVPRLEE